MKHEKKAMSESMEERMSAKWTKEWGNTWMNVNGKPLAGEGECTNERMNDSLCEWMHGQMKAKVIEWTKTNARTEEWLMRNERI